MALCQTKWLSWAAAQGKQSPASSGGCWFSRGTLVLPPPPGASTVPGLCHALITH